MQEHPHQHGMAEWSLVCINKVVYYNLNAEWSLVCINKAVYYNLNAEWSLVCINKVVIIIWIMQKRERRTDGETLQA